MPQHRVLYIEYLVLYIEHLSVFFDDFDRFKATDMYLVILYITQHILIFLVCVGKYQCNFVRPMMYKITYQVSFIISFSRICFESLTKYVFPHPNLNTCVYHSVS